MAPSFLTQKRKNKSAHSFWFTLALTEYNLSYLGYFAVMVTLSLYFIRFLRLDAAVAGVLLLFTSLSFRFSRVFLAPIVDRLPTRYVASLSLLLASLGYLGLAFTNLLIFIVPLFFLIGLGHGINSMLVKTLTGHASGQATDEKRSPFLRYAYLAAGVNLTTALGSILGSAFILHFPFQSVFFFASLAYGLSAVVAGFLPSLPVEPRQRSAWFKAFRLSLKLPSLRRAMTSTFLGWALYTQYYASLPLFVSLGLHRPDLLSSIFALNTILLFFQVPVSKILVRLRLPVSQGIFLAFLFFAAGYALLWLFPYWQMVYLAVILWTLGEMLLTPALDTQVAEGALLHQRQVAFTINSMIIGLGEGLGNLTGVSVMGWLLHTGEIQSFYLLFFLLALGAIGVVILIGNPRESLVIRKFRGLPLIQTGKTSTLPPLLSFLPQGGVVQTILQWLGKTSFHNEAGQSYLLASAQDEQWKEESNEQAWQAPERISSPLRHPELDEVTKPSTILFTPAEAQVDVFYHLPCGHEQRTSDARYCSICGAFAVRSYEQIARR